MPHTRLVLEAFVGAPHALPRMRYLLLGYREQERRKEFHKRVHERP